MGALLAWHHHFQELLLLWHAPVLYSWPPRGRCTINRVGSLEHGRSQVLATAGRCCCIERVAVVVVLVRLELTCTQEKPAEVKLPHRAERAGRKEIISVWAHHMLCTTQSTTQSTAGLGGGMAVECE